jgi:anti-sigma B factor antagonist
MPLDSRREGGILILEAQGEIDGKTAPAFQEQVLALLEPKAPLLLSFARVSFLSSAGLRSLLLIHREARARDTRVIFVQIPTEIRGSMAATGFLAFFTVHDSVSEGLAAAISDVAG